MLKRILPLFSLSFIVLALSSCSEATPNHTSKPSNGNNNNSNYDKKFQIMEDDDLEGTDVFAIPLDRSDIEDQREVNRLQGKNPNDLTLPQLKGSNSNQNKK